MLLHWLLVAWLGLSGAAVWLEEEQLQLALQMEGEEEGWESKEGTGDGEESGEESGEPECHRSEAYHYIQFSHLFS